MMIVSADGAVIFIMPGLDNTLLRSSAQFSARSPDMIFDTIKGKNIDLFDTVPGGFRSPLSGSRDGATNDVRFDCCRFSVARSTVTGRGGRAGHVIDWTETAQTGQTESTFVFAAPILGRGLA
jgi:hypothetical protein